MASGIDRSELAQAIDYSRKEGATLIIAKLDRLASSVAFIFALRDSSVKFIACDMPECNSRVYHETDITSWFKGMCGF